MSENILNLRLPSSAVNYLVTLLAERPLKESMGLYSDLRGQVAAQVQQQETPADETLGDEEGGTEE